MTVKTLETAIGKATALPEATQEQLGYELLKRIESLERLRVELQAGVSQLDSGLGDESDIKDVIDKVRREHAKR